VPSIAVRTEPSSAGRAVAVEHAGEASARAGSPGTAAPLAVIPARVVADEPARPGVQPAHTTTPTVSSAAAASEASARDVAAQAPMP
jgi:hypothetical protein